MKLTADLVISVIDNGSLIFILPSKSTFLVYDSEATGMWVVLREQGWNIVEAATKLSAIWDVEPELLHARMVNFIADLLGKGVFSC